jgi:beta-glucosidase
LKFDDSGFNGNATDCVSGSSGNSQQPLSWLTYVPTGDLDAATAAASAADIVIVAVATTSSEGSDRSTLSLSDDENDLVAAAATANSNTIVVANAPGALLMPWADDVAAILMSFMPGEQGGAGQTDVLYGDVNPSARLPITLPNMDNEIAFTEDQYPGVGVDQDHTFATYSEELLIGYRWYYANNVVPNFAFGHGLSYTAFTYSKSLMINKGDDSDYSYTIGLSITNTGDRAGSEVAQLYLGFPESAQEPPMQLKGISKITLDVGGDDLVVFELSVRDFSIWDVDAHAWSPLSGTFTVYVGAASDDIRASDTIEV